MKAGFVYFFGTRDGLVKIGNSKNPELRVASLSLPFRGELLNQVYSEDCTKTERAWHWLMRDRHVNGEWFQFTDVDWMLMCDFTETSIGGIHALYDFFNGGPAEKEATV